MPKAVSAVVFDFDGVILESMDVKTRAFAELFAPEGPRAVSAIVAHHKANGGVSRFEKFRFAYREVLRRPLSQDEERALGERFNTLVEEAVCVCGWVAGALDFLEAYHERIPLFVASGTPTEELRRIVERRRLKKYFRGVHGTPETKERIILRIAEGLRLRPSAMTVVGDALSDWEGARKAGTAFIGRVRPGDADPFPLGTTVLPDLGALPEALAL